MSTLHPDLFGEPTPIRQLAPGKGYTGGYAARPGTGPLGKTCRQCAHYTHANGRNRAYPKCGLMESEWTNGKGSDIKAGSPACAKFDLCPEASVRDPYCATCQCQEPVRVAIGRWVMQCQLLHVRCEQARQDGELCGPDASYYKAKEPQP